MHIAFDNNNGDGENIHDVDEDIDVVNDDDGPKDLNTTLSW
jgi:hypothetical protein